MHKSKDADQFTSWEPEPAYAVLLPSRLPTKHGELYLPESYTKKANSGICIAVGNSTNEELVGKECFFPTHQEYTIIDSDTKVVLYVVQVQLIIMTRTAPADIARVSRENARDGLQDLNFRTLEHSTPNGN